MSDSMENVHAIIRDLGLRAPEPPSAEDEDEAEVRWTFDELRRIADRGDGIDAWSVREVSRLVDDLLAERDALAAENAAMKRQMGEIAETLHGACQRHHLGLGGEHVDKLVVEALDALAADAAFAEWLRRSCSIVWQTPYVAGLGGSDIKHTPHSDAWASLRAQFENERRPPQAATQRAERGTNEGEPS